jgi:anti-sigma factor RsiW
MQCEKIRDLIDELWSGELPAAVRDHLTACQACQRAWRDARLARAGFRSLAEEPVPEASLGFVPRLLRRLRESAAESAQEEFFVHVGRRFVYATLMLTLALLLAMVLPATGPVRGPATADLMLAEPEIATARTDRLVGVYLTDMPDATLQGQSDHEPKGQQ